MLCHPTAKGRMQWLKSTVPIAGVKLPETVGGKTAVGKTEEGKTEEKKVVEVDDEKLENKLLNYLSKRASYVSELGREFSEEIQKSQVDQRGAEEVER